MNEMKEKVLDSKDRSYATGKRKNSIARVWLKKVRAKYLLMVNHWINILQDQYYK